MSTISRPIIYSISLALIATLLATIFFNNSYFMIFSFSIIGILLAIWFLESFVLSTLPIEAGPAKDKALKDMYTFSYAVTFLALILLLTYPFGTLQNQGTSDTGPIRLLRGCVVVDPEAQQSGGKDSKYTPTGTPICSAAPADAYANLLTIGGVVAKVDPANGARVAVYQVRDGFVIPFFQIILAFVGAIINLFRRIPEFQKRTHDNFIGSETEKPLQPFEAREFVTFQILQLIAAPFICMVAIYTITPTTLASAIGLSFASGMFSENVLLRIRALVEGTAKTPTEANSQVAALLGKPLSRPANKFTQEHRTSDRRLVKPLVKLAWGRRASD